MFVSIPSDELVNDFDVSPNLCDLTFDMVGQEVTICVVQLGTSNADTVFAEVKLATDPAGGKIHTISNWGFDTVYDSDALTFDSGQCPSGHPWFTCTLTDQNWTGPCPFTNCRTAKLGAFDPDPVDLDCR